MLDHSGVLTRNSTVGVIGAGSVGLFAAKEVLCFLSNKCVPLTKDEIESFRDQLVIFERANDVGGVWQSTASGNGNAYDSLYTNSSRGMMEISDFPWSEIEVGAVLLGSLSNNLTSDFSTIKYTAMISYTIDYPVVGLF